MIFVDDGTVDPPGTWTTTTSWREGDPMVGTRIEGGLPLDGEPGWRERTIIQTMVWPDGREEEIDRVTERWWWPGHVTLN